MKVIACSLSSVAVGVIAMTIASGALADPDVHASFDVLKALAGEWQGALTTTPPDPSVQGKIAHVTLRVTSSGNALMHEMGIPGQKDDPITMVYLDDNRLMLTHYCDAGNRPRMVGKMVPGGNKVEFNLLDVSGSTQFGHMHGAAFTIIDPNHHVEDWNFMLEGKGPVLAHFDLQRVK